MALPLRPIHLWHRTGWVRDNRTMSAREILKLSCGVCGGTVEAPFVLATERREIITQFNEAHSVCRAASIPAASSGSVEEGTTEEAT
jgi:hypothetical protein